MPVQNSELKYIMDPPLCAETDLQCMKMRASLDLTNGDPGLTPTAVQWNLKVDIQANGNTLAFDFMDNLLRCFVSGSFMSHWAVENEAPMYEQDSTGYQVVFSCGSMFPPATANRSQVKGMTIMLEFAHNEGTSTYVDQNSLFADTLSLADYGFDVWMHSVDTIAPAVFTNKYKRISSMQPFFRPLKLALGLPRDSSMLEQIAEQAVVENVSPLWKSREARTLNRGATSKCHQEPIGNQTRPNDIELSLIPFDQTNLDSSRDHFVWESPGHFFRSGSFETRRFVVLTGESEEVHECVFLSQLLKPA